MGSFFKWVSIFCTRQLMNIRIILEPSDHNEHRYYISNDFLSPFYGRIAQITQRATDATVAWTGFTATRDWARRPIARRAHAPGYLPVPKRSKWRLACWMSTAYRRAKNVLLDRPGGHAIGTPLNRIFIINL